MAKRISFFLIVTLFFLGSAMAEDTQRDSATARRLKADTEIQGYPCAAGKVWYYVQGGLRSCKVSREAAFGEARIPEGSAIYLSSDGKPDFALLSRDTTIHGYLCRGHGHDYSTAFHPDGALKVCWLAADQEVQGIPCMQASLLSDVFGGTVGVYFYNSGKLQTCKLSRDASIQDRKLKRGEHIFLDADGNVIR